MEVVCSFRYFFCPRGLCTTITRTRLAIVKVFSMFWCSGHALTPGRRALKLYAIVTGTGFQDERWGYEIEDSAWDWRSVDCRCSHDCASFFFRRLRYRGDGYFERRRQQGGVGQSPRPHLRRREGPERQGYHLEHGRCSTQRAR